MTTALDTNVLSALWNNDDVFNRAAAAALRKAQEEGTLVICGAVYSELLGSPLRTEPFVDRFCEETGIAVEWELNEQIWRAAGRAFQQYAARRKRHGGNEPRRVLADFVIGAHAAESGYKLLTADAGLYQRAFPKLRLQLI